MTNSDDKRLVRPTFRCLRDDLAQEAGPAELRMALPTLIDDLAADPTHLLPCPLVDVDHAVLDKANLIARDEAAHREPIVVITDRHVIKVKTGDRRAALWQDDIGTWWLLAAGRRKDDGPGDFYRELKRFSKDSSPIAPTEADERYHRLEAAYAAECEAERQAHGAVLGALLTAARGPGSAVVVEVFGATAKRSIVTLAYVTGIEIVGLCGASVVAHRDYEKYPVCPSCQENLELLRQLRS